MLILGLVLAAIGAAYMLRATLMLADANSSSVLPMTWGNPASPPSKRTRKYRILGQTFAAFGSLYVVNALWNFEAPLPSIAGGAATLLAAVAMPVLLVTVSHNRSVRSRVG